MHPRRKISFFLLIVIGVVIGFAIKNIKAGMLIGIVIGLLASGLISKKE
jgi:hypothetical protein